MTKQDYLFLIFLYGIDKVREGAKVAGSDPFIHTAALKHHKAEERRQLLESNRSASYVSRMLGITAHHVRRLRKALRNNGRKNFGNKK